MQGATGDDNAVEAEATAAIHLDRERVGQVGLPVDQPNHRSPVVGGTQRKRLAGAQADVQRLDPYTAVAQLDDRVSWCIVAPLTQCVLDPGQIGCFTDVIDGGQVRRRDGCQPCLAIHRHFARTIHALARAPGLQHAGIFAAADSGGKAVVITHTDAFLRQLVGWKHQAAQHRVDRNLPAFRSAAPAAQIGGNQLAGRQRHRGIVAGPLLGPYGEAALFTEQGGRRLDKVGLQFAPG